jgi:hypothetical protein
LDAVLRGAKRRDTLRKKLLAAIQRIPVRKAPDQAPCAKPGAGELLNGLGEGMNVRLFFVAMRMIVPIVLIAILGAQGEKYVLSQFDIAPSTYAALCRTSLLLVVACGQSLLLLEMAASLGVRVSVAGMPYPGSALRKVFRCSSGPTFFLIAVGMLCLMGPSILLAAGQLKELTPADRLYSLAFAFFFLWEGIWMYLLSVTVMRNRVIVGGFRQREVFYRDIRNVEVVKSGRGPNVGILTLKDGGRIAIPGRVEGFAEALGVIYGAVFPDRISQCPQERADASFQGTAGWPHDELRQRDEINLLKVLLVLFVAGGAYLGWKKYSAAPGAAVVEQAAIASSPSHATGFVSFPWPKGAPASAVLIFAPPNCPSAMAQRARELGRRLDALHIPQVQLQEASFDIDGSDQAAMAKLNRIMEGGGPPVFVRGKAKDNPSIDEVVAEYRGRRND